MNNWRKKLATPRMVAQAFSEVLLDEAKRRDAAGEPQIPTQLIEDLHRDACSLAAMRVEQQLSNEAA